MLYGAVAFGAGAGLDHVLTKGSATTSGSASSETSEQIVPFYGAHQAGIATAAQDYLHFAAFDVTSEAVEDLREILEQWTAAAVALTAGRPYQPGVQELGKPPVDPGEAVGLVLRA